MRRLSIVGCGTLGKQLIELYAERSLYIAPSFDILDFIDPDIVTDEGVYQYYPKVFAIDDLICKINPFLNCRAFAESFPTCLNLYSEEELKETLFIDCRDTNHQSDIFYMKITSDGPYGRIIKYPKNNDVDQPTNYKIEKSDYYSKLTASRVLEDIMNVKFPLDSSVRKKGSVYCVINHTIPII